ncbi:MAG: aldo/keto reductase [Beutenbergiaceae bacterium]
MSATLPRAVLGNTGMQVSQVSLGTGSLGEFFGPLPEPDAIALVHASLDRGINFIDTSPYYGSAEERLGRALVGRRDQVYLCSKAGRYGDHDFDYTPAGIRHSVERSLRLLGTDYLDIALLHDIEFVDLGPIIAQSIPTLRQLKAEGKVRAIGVSGYPLATMRRIINESAVDVVLTYAHGTLLDDSIRSELAPVAAQHGVGLINAASIAMGLITPTGARADSDHRAGTPVKQAAARMNALCQQAGVDLAFVANQYSIQRSGCPTTLIGTGRLRNIESAIEAALTPIDESLLQALLAERPPLDQRQWSSGLEENN